MILIVCVDDNMGMLFGNRRQSQDRVLRETILSETSVSKLWMNAYSFKQFATMESSHIVVDEACLEKAEEQDYCFIENLRVQLYEHKITKVILYKWNRKYPADCYFDIVLKEPIWRLVSTKDINGYAHEKITQEVYIR